MIKLNKKLLTICAVLFLTNCKNVSTDHIPLSEPVNTTHVIIDKIPNISSKDVIEKIQKTEIDYVANEQNGGILGFDENGWRITPQAWAKYNLLIKDYGNTFEPPIYVNDGITFVGLDTYISQEFMIKFAQMNLKKKGIIND